MNYDSWSALFQAFFASFDLQDPIQDPSLTTITSQWEKLDVPLKLWLHGTLFQSLLNTVLKPDDSAWDVWNTLQNLFHDNKDARAMYLDQELRS